MRIMGPLPLPPPQAGEDGDLFTAQQMLSYAADHGVRSALALLRALSQDIATQPVDGVSLHTFRNALIAALDVQVEYLEEL